MVRRLFPIALAFLAACAGAPRAPLERPASAPIAWPDDSRAVQLKVLNRVAWGASRSSAAEIARLGTGGWLAAQLQPSPATLPADIQARVDEMTISRRSLADLGADLESRRRALQKAPADERKAERQAYNEDLQRLAREAQTRMLLRALYSPNQLEEHLTWFWLNHFNVFQYKGPLRALVADYEERAIRPHVLGRFRELLGATARHPAMLIYLDNARNAAHRLNENYARELMELHTLGVDGGYTQADVQELARILTGHSVSAGLGEFAFYPRRHDDGDKELLGRRIKARGAAELEEALDLLARHPSTARFVSRKLALYLAQDEPPAALVERMAQAFQASDGDIAAVLRTLFGSEFFSASLGKKFKDPVHYLVSALRLAYDERPIADTAPLIGALARMGEPLYARPTPDGYPLERAAWASSGQLATRFEVARAIAYAPGAFGGRNGWYRAALEKTLGAATRAALEQAASPQEWNMLLLSSPEFMHR